MGMGSRQRTRGKYISYRRKRSRSLSWALPWKRGCHGVPWCCSRIWVRGGLLWSGPRMSSLSRWSTRAYTESRLRPEKSVYLFYLGRFYKCFSDQDVFRLSSRMVTLENSTSVWEPTVRVAKSHRPLPKRVQQVLSGPRRFHAKSWKVSLPEFHKCLEKLTDFS